MSKWYSGTYSVINREKYIGKSDPAYRSSWEKRFCSYLDRDPRVLKWGYECIRLPYIFEMLGKKTEYWVDFYVELLSGNEVRRFLIEIKPSGQTIQPKKPKINNAKSWQRYKYELTMWMKNQNKWKVAEAFAQRNNMKFKIITENDVKF